MSRYEWNRKDHDKLWFFKGFIFDMDGVIWRGDNVIDGAIEVIARLRKAGKRLSFVSNNSTKSRKKYMEKISNLRLPIDISQIVPSTYATAEFISNEKPSAKIYVIGAPGLREELTNAGLVLCEEPDNVDYLVTGSDPDINFKKLTYGVRVLLSGTKWVATNPDRLFPSAQGVLPGTGAVIGSLQYMTRRRPDVIIGKPSVHLINLALKMLGLTAKDCVIVGDMLDTDVLAGKAANMAAVLVLSGVTNYEDLRKSEIKPDFVLNSIKDLISVVKQEGRI